MTLTSRLKMDSDHAYLVWVERPILGHDSLCRLRRRVPAARSWLNNLVTGVRFATPVFVIFSGASPTAWLVCYRRQARPSRFRKVARESRKASPKVHRNQIEAETLSDGKPSPGRLETI